ncbi:MAG: hypothetical protein J7K61_01595 [Thermoplasmata archaeon]|nr:hypothetical protein [Thermoplasmata archaeon]
MIKKGNRRKEYSIFQKIRMHMYINIKDGIMERLYMIPGIKNNRIALIIFFESGENLFSSPSYFTIKKVSNI